MQAHNKKHSGLQRWHATALLMAGFDMFSVALSYFLALWLRYDCAISEIPPAYFETFARSIGLHLPCCLVVFWSLRLYRTFWEFASIRELMRTLLASLITVGIYVGQGALFAKIMPVSYYIFGMGLQFFLLIGIRFFYRFIVLEWTKSKQQQTVREKRIMLIGAGEAGEMILRDALRNKSSRLNFCCIIDDNPNTWGRFISGVPVVGGREDILLNVKKYQIDTILLAIPSAATSEKRDILNICKETGCELKNLPSLDQLLSGVTIRDMRDVAVEDLLGRPAVKVNMDDIFRQIRGKTVMVTGGGGSIGSELCRQVAASQPGMLIIFDVYENNAYEIEQELKDKYPALNLQVLIGSVRDSRRLNSVFAQYKPDIVYHAAAHKHVPLMEGSPCEAIKNNAIGTYKTAHAAMVHGCRRFVLISTDKAVNPTNIMGASKRLCEMVIQSFDAAVKKGLAGQMPLLYTHGVDKDIDAAPQIQPGTCCTEFVAVRFGNVLGSNGSVLPLFKKQIENGGPVTVTHPDIIRYFMTIPEAVSLVMQAGTYAKGGEIFVLDMGAPVKIDQLARNYIKLSGYQPDVDIPVVYTGLRPGEKLYEEKLMAEEGLQKTANKLIHIGNPIPFDTDKFLEEMEQLMLAAYDNREDIRQLVAKMVPTYRMEQPENADKDKIYQSLYSEAVGAK